VAKKKSGSKKRGPALVAERLHRNAAKRDGDYVAVMRPSTEEGREHVLSCIKRSRECADAGDAEGAARAFEEAGDARTGPLSLRGLMAKTTTRGIAIAGGPRLIDPRTGDLVDGDTAQTCDLLWPFKDVIYMMNEEAKA